MKNHYSAIYYPALYVLIGVFSLSLSLSLSSCLKDEPMYRETDIVEFRVKDGHLSTNLSVEGGTVSIMVRNSTFLKNVVPNITLSPGATISPGADVKQDFSKGSITYTVTSEDGQYVKKYQVSLYTTSSTALKFDFEKWKILNNTFKYDVLMTEVAGGADIQLWDSGNNGVWWSGLRDKYPTKRTTELSEIYAGGYAAKLETLEGKPLYGNNIAVFSGSLFYGKFVINKNTPPKSTQLGRLYPAELGRPAAFIGYYKYTRGDEYRYYDDAGVLHKTTDIKDERSMYAVIYKVTKGNTDTEWLDGTNIASDPRIVARADWKADKASETDSPAVNGFTQFVIPFDYVEEMDYTTHDYKLVVLFASSIEGDNYKGAIGSTLIVDEVEVVCEPF